MQDPAVRLIFEHCKNMTAKMIKNNYTVINQQKDYGKNVHSLFCSTDSIQTFWFFIPVSLGLCEIPQPSKELLDKYNGLKAVFYKRILNAYSKFQTNAAPVIQQLSAHEQGRAAKDYLGTVEASRGYQAALKVAA